MFLYVYVDYFVLLYKPGLTLPVRVNRATNLVFDQDQRMSTATKAQARGPRSGAFVGRGSTHSAWSALVAIRSAWAARVIGVSAESTRARLCQRPGRIRLRG